MISGMPGTKLRSNPPMTMTIGYGISELAGEEPENDMKSSSRRKTNSTVPISLIRCTLLSRLYPIGGGVIITRFALRVSVSFMSPNGVFSSRRSKEGLSSGVFWAQACHGAR